MLASSLVWENPCIHTYINSRLFHMGVGKNYRTPPATILTYCSRLIHIHTSDHTRTPVASTTHLTFMKNLTIILFTKKIESSMEI